MPESFVFKMTVLRTISAVILILMTLEFSFLSSEANKEYWVRPDYSGSGCPRILPCLTLEHYLQNSTAYFTSNTTLYFLPGSHTIEGNESTWLIVTYVHSLYLLASEGTEGNPTATIECIRNVGFAFMFSEDIHLSGLAFVNCGSETPTYVRNTLFYAIFNSQLHAALAFVSVHSLIMEHVHVRESYGYGLVAQDLTGNNTLNGCKFLYNNWRACNESDCITTDLSLSGGNAMFVVTLFRLWDRQKPYLTEELFSTQLGPFIQFWLSIVADMASSISEEYSPVAELSSSLHIVHSEFAHGVNPYMDTVLSAIATEFQNVVYAGAGLVLIFPHMSYAYQYSNYIVSNCNFFNNSATIGSNLMILTIGASNTHHSISIQNCTIARGRSVRQGGGVAIKGGIVVTEYQGFQVILSNTNFTGNSADEGGAISISNSGISEWSTSLIFSCENCVFFNNSAATGSAIYLMTTSSLNMTLSHTIFLENTANREGGAIYLSARASWDLFFNSQIFYFTISNSTFTANSVNCSMTGIVHINEISNVTIMDSSFLNNNCSAIYMTDSDLHLESNVSFADNTGGGIHANGSNYIHLSGTVSFTRNKAITGGALHIDSLSPQKTTFLYLLPNTTIYMTDNTALHCGGGIAVSGACSETTYCFFQTDHLVWKNETHPDFRTCDIAVFMRNNTAGLAGDSVFGGCLDSCLLKTSSNSEMTLEKSTFWSLVQIYGNHSQSEVAALPDKVCFCNEDSVGQSCPLTDSTEVYRGEVFRVGIMASGQYNYASAAIVRSMIAPAFTGELGESEGIQELKSTCRFLPYSIKTTLEFIELYLFITDCQMVGVLDTPTILNVTFLPCPFGFELWGHPPKCDCAAHVRKRGVSCSIDTQMITRPPTSWIGNLSSELVIHTHCPFDYCKPDITSLSLHRQSEQCSFNRTDVLCGACQPGLSLALGSSNCLQCSNFHLFLLIPFALAGLLLVAVLLWCNLTVSVGTINGLIFYANIVRVNQATFFPSSNNSLGTRFLAVFIAWLNLDLGFETCFFGGMDAYTRAWLQYAFPFYIWFLVGFLIYTSRRSSTISRLTGSNTVSVLATLFLLSYAKLLRTIIGGVSFTTLVDKEGRRSFVWLQDGNVAFLEGSHIPLFVASVIALLTFVLPFTLLVTLAPCLQARSGHRLLQWVNKLKPILDAYQGPYKDKVRYWTGLMLVVRLTLFTVFASNTLGDPQINLLAIVVVMLGLYLVLLQVGMVYKSKVLNIMEPSLVLNLGLYAAGTMFVRSSDTFSHNRLMILTCIMVGYVFAVFCLIVCYHCTLTVRKTRTWQKIKHYFTRAAHNDDREGGDISYSGSNAVQPRQPTVTVIELSQLREPLLTDN